MVFSSGWMVAGGDAKRPHIKISYNSAKGRVNVADIMVDKYKVSCHWTPFSFLT